MGTFVSYNLQVAVILSALYLAYKWLLASMTFHSFNRSIMLSILAVSFAIPLIVPVITISPSVPTEIAIDIPIAEISASNTTADYHRIFNLWRILIYTYYSGVACAVAAIAANIIRLRKITSAGKFSTLGQYQLCISNKAPGPFSWRNIIVLRPSDCDENMEMVLLHETEHLRMRHWIDLAFAQIICALQWFNPAAWLSARELKNIHEYQADSIITPENRTEYQLMLIKKTVGSSFPTFTDSLNHSQLKTRLTMMMKTKTKSSRRTAALALPAFAAIAACIIAQPAVADIFGNFDAAFPNVDETHKVSVSSANTKSSGEHKLTIRNADHIASASTIDTDRKETKHHEEEVEESVQLKVVESTEDSKIVYFLNDKRFTGNINDINPKDITSMTVVKNDPAYPQGKIMIYTEGKERAMTAVEKIAEFKGGVKAMMDFLAANIHYPADAPKDGKTYRVAVRFTITTDGTVEDAEVIHGNEKFHQEALNAVYKTSGHWIPGENDGKPVNCKFTLPVNFVAK